MRNYKQMKDEKLLREAPSVPASDKEAVAEELLRRGLTAPIATEVNMAIKPMLAKSAPWPKDLQQYQMERKIDGWRLIGRFDHTGRVRCCTRTGKRMDNLPYLEAELARLPKGTILDGEIVDLSAADGKEWNRTQEICGRGSIHRPTADNPPLTYCVFDVLEYEQANWRLQPQSSRREALERICEALQFEHISPVESVPASRNQYQVWVDKGYEGAILKRDSGIYVEGKRSPDWIKVKPIGTEDATIVGTYPAEDGSKYDGNAVGGILWRTANGVEGRAAGMDDALRQALYREPQEYIGRIVELAHGGITNDGLLRFPRFKRLRDPSDKEAA